MKNLLLIIALLPIAGNSTFTDNCVLVRVTNGAARTVHHAYGPVTLTAEVRVQPDERHRYIVVSYDFAETDTNTAEADDLELREPDTQTGAVGSERRSLDGAKDRYRHDFKLHNLEGGTYEVHATVYTDESMRAVCGRATARVIVR